MKKLPSSSDTPSTTSDKCKPNAWAKKPMLKQQLPVLQEQNTAAKINNPFAILDT